MPNALVGHLDTLLGDGIEAAVNLKHRRRLDRLGWRHVFSPSSPGVFAGGDPPPREGCRLEVLIDGANPTHRLLELPGVSRRSGRLPGPLTGLIDDG